MDQLKNELKVIKQQGNFEIVMLGKDQYAVRKTYRMFWFGPKRKTFMIMNRNSTEMTWDNVTTDITVTTLDRAEYVFNANVLKAGGI